MKHFWSKLGHRYLGKAQEGHLEVIYPDGTSHTYGNPKDTKITLHLLKNTFFKRLFLYGDIGFAESYMDGDFECDDIKGLLHFALINASHLGTLGEHEKKVWGYNLMPHINRLKHLLRANSHTTSRKNIAQHYDLSNDFFKLMLDPSMMYSCAMFDAQGESLHDAQLRKIEHLGKKLGLKKGAKVLEIGSGWGSMAMHLAQVYKAKVTTLTLSQEQLNFAKERFKEEGVEGMIDIVLQDYRDAKGEYDAIISIEMFEAVGKEYFEVFFQKCESLLAPNGVMVMQTITMPDIRYKQYAKGVDFIQKYIFPGGHLPSVAKILETTSQKSGFDLLHLESFGEHYAQTLRAWSDNFDAKIESVKALGFDDYFIRMWRMYLNYCEVAFSQKAINLVQLVFSKRS